MVLCIVALVVFSILGIWSVPYRRLAKEAFECVFRMITLRPCVTKLDEKIKSKIVARLMGRSGSLARFVYKHFKTLSWIFTVAFFGSMAYSALSIYNLIVFGSCQLGATCILSQNPVGKFIATLTCYEAQIAYVVIAVAIVVALLIKKKKVVFV
ncbi:MAG: hypothetical protein V1836_03155 [Candidatus Aenigmatarchaeota archaeon]